MERIDTLREKVKKLYEAKDPNRADWADWLYENHVFVVAKYARELSKRFGVGNDLAEAAAMLHDCADAVMGRFANSHEEKSLVLARHFLNESGFTAEEIELVVEDAIANHSCYPGHLPQTQEGKIMATADAKAHLDTDFYYFCNQQLSEQKSPTEIKIWLAEKIDRDFNAKIFFPEIRAELKASYLALKKDFDLV